MPNECIDKLGEILMTKVRDKAIKDWSRMISGQLKGETADQVRAQVDGLDPRVLKIIEGFIPRIVDTTLHHLLWTLEQEEAVDLVVTPEGGIPRSAREASDGLCGELYGDRGWIARFSREWRE